MRPAWQLERREILLLAIYSAIMPAALVMKPWVGTPGFFIAALISPPLIPVSGLVFWMSATVFNGYAAILVMWGSNLLLAWIMYVQWRRRHASLPCTTFLRHLAGIILAAVGIIAMLGLAMPYLLVWLDQ